MIIKQTLRFICGNLKRLKIYIPSILIGVALLLSVCSVSGIILSKKLYQEETFTNINIAFYLPDDDNLKYNMFGISLLEDLKSASEAVNFIQAATIDEGYEMLDKKEALYFIIVPEQFFDGIMDSTNPPLNVVFRDNSSFNAYIANELFVSYAKYLGICQAGIYSTLDTLRYHELPSEMIYQTQDDINLVFMSRVINRDSYIKNENATTENGFSIKEHYLGAAIFFTLFFMGFILMPMINKSFSHVRHTPQLIGIYAGVLAGLYIAFIPCYLCISILTKHFNPAGLLSILPAILIIGLLVTVTGRICHTSFTGNMLLLFLTICLGYIGGAVLPQAFLPEIVRSISDFLPGEFLLNRICISLFM